jgi:hypothetical protein
LGTTTITWTATDAGGATATCTQTVTVNGVLDARDDEFSVNYLDGGTAGNALANDIINCQQVRTANVTLQVVTGSGNAGVVLNTTTGDVTVTPETAPGVYTIVYRICSIANPAQCDEATIKVNVNIALPATNLELKATRMGSDVKLDWTTLTEQNTSHFIIERSYDGVQFRPLPSGSQVAAAGNSTSARYYHAVDRSATGTVVFYRVRLNDRDGKFRYSNVAMVRLSDITGMRVFPNPVFNQVTVEFGEAGVYEILLVNALGQTIMVNKELAVANGFQSVTFQRGNLSSGMYTMRITNRSTGKIHTVKLNYLHN